MDPTILVLQQEIDRLKRARRRPARFLEEHGDLKDLRLVMSVRKTTNNSYYYYYVPGDPKRHYLGNRAESRVRDIMRYRGVAEEVSEIDGKLAALDRCLAECRQHDCFQRSERMPKIYRSADLLPDGGAGGGSLNDGACGGSPDDGAGGTGDLALSEWDKAASRRYASQTAKYPQKLIHRCGNGMFVRSKSEVIIADALCARGVRFYYELEHQFGNAVVRPDFTLFSTTLDREIIWEHFGMMREAGYMQNALDKVSLYARHGFLQGRNLIVTYDEEDGGIDASVILRFIEIYF